MNAWHDVRFIHRVEQAAGLDFVFRAEAALFHFAVLAVFVVLPIPVAALAGPELSKFRSHRSDCVMRLQPLLPNVLTASGTQKSAIAERFHAEPFDGNSD